MFLLPLIFHLFLATMSSLGNNDFEGNLYSEQLADVLQRHQKLTFASDVEALFASIATFISTDASLLNPRKGRTPGSKTIKRQRLDVDEHLKSMPSALFRRKYRMGFDSFYKLLDILEAHLPPEKIGNLEQLPMVRSQNLHGSAWRSATLLVETRLTYVTIMGVTLMRLSKVCGLLSMLFTRRPR